jgi:hypothetical protein
MNTHTDQQAGGKGEGDDPDQFFIGFHAGVILHYLQLVIILLWVGDIILDKNYYCIIIGWLYLKQ